MRDIALGGNPGRTAAVVDWQVVRLAMVVGLGKPSRSAVVVDDQVVRVAVIVGVRITKVTGVRWPSGRRVWRRQTGLRSLVVRGLQSLRSKAEPNPTCRRHGRAEVAEKSVCPGALWGRS